MPKGKPKTFKCFTCGKKGSKTELDYVWCGVVEMQRFCSEVCFVRGYAKYGPSPQARENAQKRLLEIEVQ